ncbi:MAG: M23 family metallopeptidase [Planctomycetes bacterium]|nr:M23 family metallopeptidase [Planctomycetota bacterium]
MIHTSPRRLIALSVGVGLLVCMGCGTGGGVDLGGPGETPQAPVADAGPDQRVVDFSETGQTEVSLDASRSSAGSATIVEYVWTDETATIIAVGEKVDVVLPVGEHVLTLTVTDDLGQRASSSITVTVLDPATTSFELAVTVIGGGQTDPVSGVSIWSAGDFVVLTAVPDDGWRFVRWTGDVSTTQITISLFMDDDKAVAAEFEAIAVSTVPLFAAPFAAGESHVVTQGNDGTFSHQDIFAWDFNMDLGTPVVAVAAGRVIFVVEDEPNNLDGAEPDSDTPANVVFIDHGDGLQSTYAHLDFSGVKPVAGQFVAPGQCIALSGNSGFSTGPHLHYEMLDPSQTSVPSGFSEVSRPDGIALEGDTLVSQNELSTAAVDDYVESTLPVDAFSQNGVSLIAPTPPAHFLTAGETYLVRGRTLDGSNTVCAAMVEFDGTATGTCQDSLASVLADDVFSFEFTVDETLTGNFLFGIISGTDGVEGAATVPMYISPPAGDNVTPRAMADQPLNRLIGIGDIGVLDGSESFDEDGDALTYFWVQVSGSVVTILNPTAEITSFTLVGDVIDDPGEIEGGIDGDFLQGATETEGSSRLVFQLTVSDGAEVSLPAAVEFERAD